MPEAPYELFYWPAIQGRGEFVRLILEEGGSGYIDVSRLPADQRGGMAAVLAFVKGEHDGIVPFAMPVLRHGDLVISQTANICRYLGERLGLAPDGEAGRLAALQHQLTIADAVSEAHDTHHPISVSLYYEDQKAEAARRAHFFTHERLPKFLGYFERAIQRSGGPFLLGAELSYPDLSLFQLVAGVSYAFPNAFSNIIGDYPGVMDVFEHVAERPRIAAYLASDRRLPFNQQGIFRHYPELDH